MKYLKFTIFFCLLANTVALFSQQSRLSSTGGRLGNQSGNTNTQQNNTTKIKLSGKTKYTDYKIFSHHRDTSFVDTTLSIQKEYIFNYLRKDNFELLQFHNQGQTYNNLGYSFNNLSALPDFGFSAKQFPYLNIEDIKYYEVPTPTTEITYKTGLQQGQFVDAIFTVNFNKRFNVALSYKGLRSLGAYRRALVSNGNFRTSFHYRTKENQYQIRGHITTQDFFHQENGGLTADALESFINEDPNFDQRSRLDVNLEDSENQFDSNRVYLEQSFTLLSGRKKEKKSKKNKGKESLEQIQDSIKNTNINTFSDSTLAKNRIDNLPVSKDSLQAIEKKLPETFLEKKDTILKNDMSKKGMVIQDSIVAKKDSIHTNNITLHNNKGNIKIGHVFTTESKSYQFIQATEETEIFGTANTTNALDNTVRSTLLNNEFNLEFNSKYLLGRFKARANLTRISYGYDTILNSRANITNIEIADNAFSFGASWNARVKNFKLNADAQVTPGTSLLSGNYFKGEALYEKDSVFSIKGSVLVSSKAPNFNTLLHQSVYDDYNWENNFSNVNTRDLGFSLRSKWLNATANFTNIDNFTYFDENNLPQQFDAQINYLKVKVNKEFKFWKVALDNTVMYQNVSNGSDVFRVPEIVTRNTFYYSDYWFKGKPMFVNIGVTFKYFTSYFANAYNPLLAEFTLQNEEEIGFPTFDVFFNAQVRRTRLYLKVDNVTSAFTEKNYFSAPNYPFRDFTVRFGLVWNWFI